MKSLNTNPSHAYFDTLILNAWFSWQLKKLHNIINRHHDRLLSEAGQSVRRWLCCACPGAGAELSGSVGGDRGRPDPGGQPAGGGWSGTRARSGAAQRVSHRGRGYAPHTERRNRSVWTYATTYLSICLLVSLSVSESVCQSLICLLYHFFQWITTHLSACLSSFFLSLFFCLCSGSELWGGLVDGQENHAVIWLHCFNNNSKTVF